MWPDLLVVGSHNAGKVREWRALLDGLVATVLDAPTLDLPEPLETGSSFVANALAKATACCAASGQPSLSEDAGLEVHALGGAPGLVTRQHAERCGGWDLAARDLLARSGSLVTPASYRCAVAIVWPDGPWVCATGAAERHLVVPRGDGPGHAPSFQPQGQDQTWAELGPSWRAAHDHRADAFRALSERLAGRRARADRAR